MTADQIQSQSPIHILSIMFEMFSLSVKHFHLPNPNHSNTERHNHQIGSLHREFEMRIEFRRL